MTYVRIVTYTFLTYDIEKFHIMTALLSMLEKALDQWYSQIAGNYSSEVSQH